MSSGPRNFLSAPLVGREKFSWKMLFSSGAPPVINNDQSLSPFSVYRLMLDHPPLNPIWKGKVMLVYWERTIVLPIHSWDPGASCITWRPLPLWWRETSLICDVMPQFCRLRPVWKLHEKWGFERVSQNCNRSTWSKECRLFTIALGLVYSVCYMTSHPSLYHQSSLSDPHNIPWERVTSQSDQCSVAQLVLLPTSAVSSNCCCVQSNLCHDQSNGFFFLLFSKTFEL